MNHSYSIIIPAYNEEEWLPKTLRAVRKVMDAVEMPGEIIVVDNNSTDKTARVALEEGAQVVFEPINQISRARNAGARAAKGRYLFFLDADTLLPADLLETALDHLVGGSVCGGGARVSFDHSLNRFDRKLTDLWNRISVNLGVAAGSFIYCLREGFEQIGGFSEAVYASEELWFSRRLKSWGKAKDLEFRVIVDPPVITSNRKSDWFSPLQQSMVLLIMIFFPFAVRFRSLCFFWYDRPKE